MRRRPSPSADTYRKRARAYSVRCRIRLRATNLPGTEPDHMTPLGFAVAGSDMPSIRVVASRLRFFGDRVFIITPSQPCIALAFDFPRK